MRKYIMYASLEDNSAIVNKKASKFIKKLVNRPQVITVQRLCRKVVYIFSTGRAGISASTYSHACCLLAI